MWPEMKAASVAWRKSSASQPGGGSVIGKQAGSSKESGSENNESVSALQ